MSKAQELAKLREKTGRGMSTREFGKSVVTDSLDSYYENILPKDEEDKAIKKYGDSIDQVISEFNNTVGFHAEDISVLLFATFLQCARIYTMDYITRIEKAGPGNAKENKLHSFQSQMLGKLDNGFIDIPREYYAPLNQIIIGRGVPYDATAFMYEKYNVFKGGNHRFATLGHDPVLGLIFGTANILTNTITCVNAPVISTYNVEYDINLKNPRITNKASTIEMFKQAFARMDGDAKSVIAAILKQIIHIGTDLYTPCGIQLPCANLVLSHGKVEKITKIISTGDVLKWGASAGMAVLINMIITVVHSCMLESDDSHFSEQMYDTRTQKIILLSNVFASSSSVVYAALTKNIKKLDIGGLAVTINMLFHNKDFINSLRFEFINKYEFLNSEVSKRYQNKIENLYLYYDNYDFDDK